MATVPYSEIASSFLQKAGAPDTPEMRKAVEAWVRQESGGTIYSNNPWNIHDDVARDIGVRTCGKRTTLDGSETVAVFCSLDEGIAASVKLLNAPFGPQNGYDKVVVAAKSGDPIAFLDSLARSKWAGSRYGGPGAGNNLIRNYRAIGGTAVATVKDIGSDAATVASSATTYTAEQWNAFIACVTPKMGGGSGRQPNTIGPTDLPHIVSCASANKLDLSAVTLNTFVGKSLSDLRDALAATGTIPPADIGKGIIPDVDYEAIGNVFRALADPTKWLWTFVLLGGVAILGYGTIVTMRGMQKAPIPTPV